MNKFEPVRFEHLLSSVFKPSRYINSEINSYHKIPGNKTINFCLAFPDVYEVGFSHLGLKILYTILNKESDTTADRVYAPWPDFLDKLDSEDLPLFAIESRIPVKDFDVVGFTLQSELTYTNILYTLDAAKISILSKDRLENDPIILGGGPTATNPEPLADFFDAFVIGDGEEVILEIKNILVKYKNSSRQDKLEALAQIEGVYVPDHTQHIPVKIRKFMGFCESNGHKNQLLPWTEPTHYRYVSEIMRGCSRGCRFCHAGMFYRPVREKNLDTILENLLNEIDQYGWSEVALSSLSSSDYTCIKDLLILLFKELSKRETSLSLPSLRVDSLDEQIIKLLNVLRQSGLTIAPEAGSQRLRDVINKNITEEEILEGIKIALDNGWKVVKLYFMIGLPFEEQEDIDAIPDLINKILAITKKRLKINITLSPFVPKSFTPFQWAKMDSKLVLKEKATYLKNIFRINKQVKISYHEIESSQLECILGRGTRNTGKLIYQAYKDGARFDGWNEFWDAELWKQAADKVSFSWEKALSKLAIDSTLPWDHIDIGIDKDFLIRENENAKNAILTDDCRDNNCSACGICKGEIKNIFQTAQTDQNYDIQIKPKKQIQQQQWIYRVFYSKTGLMRFVSHLDLTRMTQNYLRASKLPLIYSQGYNIHPKLNFGPPLSVGVEGYMEHYDIYLNKPIGVNEIMKTLGQFFPKSLDLKKVIPVQKKAMLAMEYYNLEKISVYPEEKYFQIIQEKMEEFDKAEEWIFTRVRKGKERHQNLKEKIRSLEWIDNRLVVIKERVGASIFDFLEQVCGIPRDSTDRFRILREEMFRET